MLMGLSLLAGTVLGFSPTPATPNFVSRASCDGRCGRFPRCWCRFLRCRPSSSPASSPGSTDSKGIDGPAGVSPGEGGGIVSRRHPSPGGRAGSPWSASRARIRGLSIVLGSPFPSDGSSHQARGGVAPLVGDRGDPAATATGLPPVSSCSGRERERGLSLSAEAGLLAGQREVDAGREASMHPAAGDLGG